MLELLLTPTDGGTAWRHQLAPGAARSGWECVGPQGLVRRVGRLLGFPAEAASSLDRLAPFMVRLGRLDDGARSYSASRRSDPYGVASYLLALRDRLKLASWSGTALPGSARLRDLSALEAMDGPALPPGHGDVLLALAGEVRRVGALPVPLTIHLAAPRVGFPRALAALLDALEGAGASVRAPAPDAALAAEATDLGRLQRALLDPSSPRAALAGDGSFLLLEADTAIEAAELAASALRDAPLGATTLVVAAEAPALDAALFRQGLPTLGLSSPSRFRPHLQALPLRLDLAFRPRDPFRAAELLLLPGAPLPAFARRRLLEALNEMPGVGSPAWRRALASAVEEAVRRAREGGAPDAEAAEAGKALGERIDDWFGGEGFDPGAGIPAATAAGLCGMVASWAGARAGGADEGADDVGADLWAHAAAVARRLERVLRGHAPEERIPQLALAQLHDLAVADGAEVGAFQADAGRAAVCGAPGAILPGPEVVLWFGFVRDAGPAPAPEPWTEAERPALEVAGVRAAAPGAARELEAWGWRRPLLAARSRCVLVRWRLAGDKPVPAHALLDELQTRAAPESLGACTFGSERLLAGGAPAFAPRSVALDPAAPVSPRAVWAVPPEALRPPGPLSASALDALLGCPFKWALERNAQLRPGRGVDLPEGSRLLGDFAHRILQDMLVGDGHLDTGTATPEEASTWAARAFDARVASEAAPLVRQGREVERDAARTLIANAAGAIVRFLRAGEWAARSVEEEVHGEFARTPVQGYVDLVLTKSGRTALLDFKLSGAKYRRAELQDGHALQLALYASMLRQGGGPLPPAGFLTLDDGQLLTTSPQAFPGATVVDGPSAEETLRGAETMFDAWTKVLEKGFLPVCSEELPWEEPVVAATGPLPDDPLARRAPSCLFCTFKTLCRARVGEEVAA